MTVRASLLLAAATALLLAACGQPAATGNDAPAGNDASVAPSAQPVLRIGGVRFNPRNIAGATQGFDHNGEPVVVLTFTPSGRARWRRAQRDRLGQVLEIRVDDELVSSPVLLELVEGN